MDSACRRPCAAAGRGALGAGASSRPSQFCRPRRCRSASALSLAPQVTRSSHCWRCGAVSGVLRVAASAGCESAWLMAGFVGNGAQAPSNASAASRPTRVSHGRARVRIVQPLSGWWRGIPGMGWAAFDPCRVSA
ncbi:hypothetical protein SDC9_77846 [bioreactor metagenome]|uniref:Uncharacterized protein n=1 Tax=bioreactor metagenome TaxID=1076179 RepID=A0A644YTV0_9ZZZZ